MIQYKCSHGEAVQNIQLLMGELVNGTDAPQYEIDISDVFYDLQGEVVGIGGDRLFRSHHRWVSHLDDGFLSHRRKL